VPFHTYVLRSLSTGRFYIGHTGNLPKRIAQHNSNRVSSLKNRGPWELVYTEEYPTRAGASQRERQIKRMKSRRWIEQLLRASL
jgi:putative endonuclease